jgi:hypothetical protein
MPKGLKVRHRSTLNRGKTLGGSGRVRKAQEANAFRRALGLVKLWRRASGNGRKIRSEIRSKLLIYKYFTRKSLFLKDLAKHQR